MTTCIVNVAIGRSWFPRGQALLLASIPAGVGNLFWSDSWPSGPTHAEAPYAFKFPAMQIALQDYDRVWWMDASCRIAGDFDKLNALLDDNPVVLFRNWCHLGGYWNLAQWCSDQSLALMGRTREEARKMPLPVGGIIGVKRGEGDDFMAAMMEQVEQRTMFQGPHTNDGTLGDCMGHRHDQCVLAHVCDQLGIEFMDRDGYFDYEDQNPKEGTVVRCKGL